MRYRISYWCASHIGKLRKTNQDNFICDGKFMEADKNQKEIVMSGTKKSKEEALFGIFDGMGGEECGEIASYIAARNAEKLAISEDTVSQLKRFCQKTNDDICRYIKENQLWSMGTTAAMLAFTKKKIVLCNIGDSKIFRLHEGELEQISKDHVTPNAFGKKPLLSQNLGIPPTEFLIEPYLAEGEYDDDDRYLICSDGLSDMVKEEEITEILNSKKMDEAGSELLEKALLKGGKDNISIILCEIKQESSYFWDFLK